MITLDHALLEDLGLGSLSDADKSSLLTHLHETLQQRSGTRLMGRLTPVQLDDFENVMAYGDINDAQTWLQDNVPDYQSIVVAEFEDLTAEVRQNAAVLLDAVSLGR